MVSKHSKTKDRNRTFYEQGFKDATTTGWFRWRKHPSLNSYRLGFKAGLKTKATTTSRPSKRGFKAFLEKLRTFAKL